MKKISIKYLVYDICLLLIVLSAMVGTAGATIFTVDQSGSGTHTTIQGAIDASGIGDTVNVNSGTYDESLSINKQLIVTGINTGTGKPIIKGTRPIYLLADGVTIDGFIIKDASIKR